MNTEREVARVAIRDNNLLVRYKNESRALKIDVSGIDLPEAQVRYVGRVLARACLENPTAHEYARILDRALGRVVTEEAESALATRIWRAHGGREGDTASTRLDGTRARA